MSSRKPAVILAVVLVVAAAGGGYIFHLLKQGSAGRTNGVIETGQAGPAGPDELAGFRLYYPVEGTLQMKEKRLQRRSRQTETAEAVMEEFFRGPGNGTATPIPPDVKVLGAYRDSGQVLYVDLSDEFRRNFQGDALAEYLVLKGIYESLMANVQEIQDVKILVEGKELESMGGHLLLRFPLRGMVFAEVKGVQGRPHE